MILATPDVALKQKAHDTKRAQASATFEVLPRLLGFNEDVILRGVRVDQSRNIVYFYFAGEGLDEYEDLHPFDTFEGQESYQIVPPAWDPANEKLSS